MISSEPVSQVAHFVSSDQHFTAHSVQLRYSFAGVAEVLEHVVGVDSFESLVSERQAAYVGQDEIRDLDIGFLKVTVHFALQVVESVFASSAAHVEFQVTPPQTDIIMTFLFIL